MVKNENERIKKKERKENETKVKRDKTRVYKKSGSSRLCPISRGRIGESHNVGNAFLVSEEYNAAFLVGRPARLSQAATVASNGVSK